MVKVDITVERTVRVCKEFEVTEAQLMELKDGINPFFDEFENDLFNGDGEYDYYVCDEDGNSLVDWSK